MDDHLKALAKKANKLTKTQQRQPGKEEKMLPKPAIKNSYIGSGKLANKVTIITGGDSGIGHAVAILFAKEGADVVIAYLSEDKDAKNVQKEIELLGRSCLLIKADISKEINCKKIVAKTINKFGKLDILVNNAAQQYPQNTIENISPQQLLKTFSINIFSYFYMTKAALPYLKNGSAIINTTSVTAYKGSKDLIDYSSSKGAIVAFTRSLSESIAEKGIRINAVAPGPVWTPLIPATFNSKRIKNLGKNVPMKRMGQPEEIAPCYVFLACDDSSYMSGQVLHPNGGVIVNS